MAEEVSIKAGLPVNEEGIVCHHAVVSLVEAAAHHHHRHLFAILVHLCVVSIQEQGYSHTLVSTRVVLRPRRMLGTVLPIDTDVFHRSAESFPEPFVGH